MWFVFFFCGSTLCAISNQNPLNYLQSRHHREIGREKEKKTKCLLPSHAKKILFGFISFGIVQLTKLWHCKMCWGCRYANEKKKRNRIKWKFIFIYKFIWNNVCQSNDYFVIMTTLMSFLAGILIFIGTLTPPPTTPTGRFIHQQTNSHFIFIDLNVKYLKEFTLISHWNFVYSYIHSICWTTTKNCRRRNKANGSVNICGNSFFFLFLLFTVCIYLYRVAHKPNRSS